MMAAALASHSKAPCVSHSACAVPGDVGEQAGGQQPLRLTHSFDLATHEGFLLYWARLQYAVVGSNRQGARLTLADPLRQCFPFDRATEVRHMGQIGCCMMRSIGSMCSS